MISKERRSLLKMLGLTPVAVPMMGRVAAEQSVGGLAIGGYGTPPAPGVGAWVRAALPKMVWKALEKERNDRMLRFQRGVAYRLGAFDHDIACMKSWSVSFAISRQQGRDFAYQEWLKETENRLWPQDND